MRNNAFFQHRYFNVIVFFIFILIVFIAYYFNFNKFGLYEDDYFYLALPANSSFHELLLHLKRFITTIPEGRLFGFSLPFILVYLLFNIGGISLVYLFGMVIVALNGYLLFLTIKSRFPYFLGLLVGLVFIISPTDTTKALQIHVYQLQLSVLFLMVAFRYYLKSKYILSYFFALSCLLTYEIAFLPFIFIPMLHNLKWGKEVIIKQLKHFIVIFLLVGFVLVIRKLAGENRVESMVLSEAIVKTIKSIFIGPLAGLYSYLNAIYESIVHINITYIYIIVSFIIVFVFLYFSVSDKGNINSNNREVVNYNLFSKIYKVSDVWDNIIKIVVIGFLMLSVSYLFAMTHYPPTEFAGRGTSVHLAASISTSLIVGGIIYGFVLLMSYYNYKMVSFVIISLVISFWIGFGSIMQKDFSESWKIQKNFWNDVVTLCPDVEENTLIFVPNKNLEKTKYIITYSWACPMIFEQIFSFPEQWHRVPKLEVVIFENSTDFKVNNNEVIFLPRYPFMFDNKEQIILNDGNVIVLEKDANGNLSRKFGLINIMGVNIRLKDFSVPTLDKMDRKNLYPFIINE